MTHSTILSHRPTLLKTMAPLDAGGYGEGLRLTCLLTHVGPGSIELDRAELRAVLRELPTALLLEALGERGLDQSQEARWTPLQEHALDTLEALGREIVDNEVLLGHTLVLSWHGQIEAISAALTGHGERHSEASELLACTPADPLNAPLTEAEESELQAAVAHLAAHDNPFLALDDAMFATILNDPPMRVETIVSPTCGVCGGTRTVPAPSWIDPRHRLVSCPACTITTTDDPPPCEER